MWRSVRLMKKWVNRPHVWEEHVVTVGDDGIRRTVIETYPKVQGIILEDWNRSARNKNGYYVHDGAQFIIDAKTLEENDIDISVKTSYIRESDRLWRITGYMDYKDFVQGHVYLCTLEKSEVP